MAAVQGAGIRGYVKKFRGLDQARSEFEQQGNDLLTSTQAKWPLAQKIARGKELDMRIPLELLMLVVEFMTTVAKIILTLLAG